MASAKLPSFGRYSYVTLTLPIDRRHAVRTPSIYADLRHHPPTGVGGSARKLRGDTEGPAEGTAEGFPGRPADQAEQWLT